MTTGIQIERRDLRDVRSRLIDRSGRLAAVDDRYAVWAGEVGVPVGSLGDSSSQEDAIAEIDALVAHLYGLSRFQLEHVFATFHRGWAYEEPLAATLEHYDRWAKQLGGDDA
ncbi:MAG: hypothetical protein GKR84_03475 [Candidatus Nanopelagicales bacterium]|nr:hypothetical protein [Candidatus Nanopelagicales bacterium]